MEIYGIRYWLPAVSGLIGPYMARDFPFRLVKFGFKDGICTAIYTAICWTIPIIASAMVVDFSAMDLHSHLEESTCSTWVILASTSKVFKTWTHGSVLSMAWSCWCVAMAIFGPTRHDVAWCYRCVSLYQSTSNQPEICLVYYDDYHWILYGQWVCHIMPLVCVAYRDVGQVANLQTEADEAPYLVGATFVLQIRRSYKSTSIFTRKKYEHLWGICHA